MKRLERFGQMLPLLVVGLVLQFSKGFFPGLRTEVLESMSALGSALVVAFVLAVSVDWWLKISIVQDAFKTAIGYILPEELKPELEWIYGRHVICTQHIQDCELAPIDNNTLIFRTKVKRVMRNVSHSREKVHLGLAIDEWFNPARSSRILEFGYVLGNKRWPGEGEHYEVKKGSYDLHIEPLELELAPQEELTAYFTSEEIKRTNDEASWVFIWPTKQPLVTVNGYSGLCVTVDFGHREAPGTVKLGTGSFMLPGTLLPFQSLHIRWWNDSDAKRWIEGAEA